MNKIVKRIASLIPLVLLLTGCMNDIENSDILLFLKVLTGIAFGMAVLGGIVVMASDDSDRRSSSGAVGLIAATVGVLLIIILVA